MIATTQEDRRARADRQMAQDRERQLRRRSIRRTLSWDDFTAGVHYWIDNPVRLSCDEQRKLKERADCGDNWSRDLLVVSSLRQAMRTAWGFHIRHELDAVACISGAHVGALRAVRDFDPDRAGLMAFVKVAVFRELQSCLRFAVSRREITNTDAEENRRADLGILHRVAARSVGPNRQRQWERIQEAIHRLPSDLRRVAKLAYFDERNGKEIAETLGVSRGAVLRRMDQAIERLRAELRATADEADVLDRPVDRRGARFLSWTAQREWSAKRRGKAVAA